MKNFCMMKSAITLLISIFLLQGPLWGLTIAEKKAGGSSAGGTELSAEMKQLLNQVNVQIARSRGKLRDLYAEVKSLRDRNAPPEEFEPLLWNISVIKDNIREAEENWRQQAIASGKGAGYSLWNQPDTTIGQLVDDYGSAEYIYVMPPEISKMKISIDSNLPIPHSSWGEILEVILDQNGIGVKQINPFLRELFLVQTNVANLSLITARRGDLEFFAPGDRVAFILQPDPIELKRIWYFLNRFVNPDTTILQMVGREILIIARVSEVRELLKVYEFVAVNKGNIEYRAVRVNKVDAEEMAKILSAIFEGISEAPTESSGGMLAAPAKAKQSLNQKPQSYELPKGKALNNAPSANKAQQIYGSSNLTIIPLKDIAQALVLIGTREEIAKAEEIIAQVESQVGRARERVIFWYNVRHSDPEELADVLSKIYDLMVSNNARGEGYSSPEGPGGPEGSDERRPEPPPSPFPGDKYPSPQPPFVPFAGSREVLPPPAFYLNSSSYLVNPEDVRLPRPPPNQGRDNFIVDLKTNALVMVVESDVLSELKDLIRKLDVPKKMVQIEIMLVEQVVTHNDSLGLNFLNLGAAACNSNVTSLSFDSNSIPLGGIGDFIIQRKGSKNTPAFDLAYQFLISRDDVRVNASPSLLTINQTEATIELEEEISVSVGSYPVNNNGNNDILQNTYQRARYGIKIDVTPTVHMNEAAKGSYFCDGLPNYITLDSEIKFETIVGNAINDTRPPVIRRALKNQARVADGQTVIIGGFRRKDSRETTESIPFLGELPGIGMLFSDTTMRDTSTEMFLFMTSKIVTNPEDELERIKMEEMSRRAGDLPYFTKALLEAREQERKELFQGSLRLLFGPTPDRLIDTEALESCVDIGESCYDGR